MEIGKIVLDCWVVGIGVRCRMFEFVVYRSIGSRWLWIRIGMWIKVLRLK